MLNSAYGQDFEAGLLMHKMGGKEWMALSVTFKSTSLIQYLDV